MDGEPYTYEPIGRALVGDHNTEAVISTELWRDSDGHFTHVALVVEQRGQNGESVTVHLSFDDARRVKNLIAATERRLK
jgi:hypothetical protein